MFPLCGEGHIIYVCNVGWLSLYGVRRLHTNPSRVSGAPGHTRSSPGQRQDVVRIQRLGSEAPLHSSYVEYLGFMPYFSFFFFLVGLFGDVLDKLFSFPRLKIVPVSFRWLREGVLILNKSVAATGHSESRLRVCRVDNVCHSQGISLYGSAEQRLSNSYARLGAILLSLLEANLPFPTVLQKTSILHWSCVYIHGRWQHGQVPRNRLMHH